MTSLFSYQNYVDSGALTSGSAAQTLPVNNLASRILQKNWRALVTPTFFAVDFGTSLPIGVLGLFASPNSTTTLIATDTVQHQLSNVAIGGADVLDTGAIACGFAAPWNQHIYVPGSAISARYWKCTIAANSRASAGYFDLGRAWAGATWSPSVNPKVGWGDNWQDDSQVTKALRSGAAFPAIGGKYRRVSLSYDRFTETDRTNAMNMDFTAGTSGQILCVPFTEQAPNLQALLGRIAGSNVTSSATTAATPQIATASPIKQTDESLPPGAGNFAYYSKDYILEQDL